MTQYKIKQTNKQATQLKNEQRTWIDIFWKMYRRQRGTYKMLNNINHQENVNKNYNKIYHLTFVRMAIIKKTRNDMSWWEYGERGNLHCWWEWCCQYGKQSEVPPKIKNRTPYDLAILRLGFFQKNQKLYLENIYAPHVHWSITYNN